MDILIIENQKALVQKLQPFLEQKGAVIAHATSREEAASFLIGLSFDVILIDSQFDNGKALGIAELADFRQPEAKMIFMSDSTIFSDGSIYRQFSNLCSYLPRSTHPQDIAMLVEYQAAKRSKMHRQVELN